MGALQLSDRVVQTFASAKVFKDNQAVVNSIDFHRTKDLLVTGGADDEIHLFDTWNGSLIKRLSSKKYGVANISFTHHESAIIYSSTKDPRLPMQVLKTHAIRYHSLHDNTYLRYYAGHEGLVTSLSMSPKSDLFLSAGLDQQVRLWDLRSAAGQGSLKVPGDPCVAFDQQGLVFAVGATSGVIKLYDIKTCQKGPFVAFQVPELLNSPQAFSCLRFSNDGELLLAVSEGCLHVLNAFNGAVVHKFSTGLGEGSAPMEASFSPDNQYLVSGCDDHALHIWSLHSGAAVAKLEGHPGLATCVKWAPQRMLLASACRAVSLWTPDIAKLRNMGS